MTQVQPGDYIQIDNDMWEDVGKKFLVQQAIYRDDSTAVHLVLEYASNISHRNLAQNQIIKVS